MSTPAQNEWLLNREGGDPRGHGQPSRGYMGQYPGAPPEPNSSSTSLDTDPSEDESSDSEYVPDSVPATGARYPESLAENSPNSLSELGLRDHSDPGPEGSHQGHGGRVSADLSRPVQRRQHHRSDDSLEELSSSSSQSVTSRRRYPELETPPEIVRRERRRSRSRPPHQVELRPRGAGRTERDPNNGVIRELRELVGRMGSRRQSREHQAPPSPPDFLKMVMVMQNLGTQKFLGDKGPTEADSWLKHVERNFHAARCPNDFRTDVAVHYLLKDACNWWEGVRIRYAGMLVTWEQFKEEFERKYFPPEARDRMEAQFLNLVQGQRSVRDYEAEFTRLRPYAHYGTSDEPAVIRKFLRGLRPQLMSRLVVNKYHSLFELVERAVDVEEGIRIEESAENRVEQRYRDQRPSGPKNQVARTGPWTPGKGRGSGQGQTSGRGQGQEQGPTPGQALGRGAAGRGTPTMDLLPRCYKCGGKGHFARACPQMVQTSRPANVVCYTCNQPGHYASACPVTHPNGPDQPRVGLRALEWDVEPPAKRVEMEGRVYPLDKPEPSRPYKGPVAGT